MLQLGIFVAVTAASLTFLRALAGVWGPERGRLRRRLGGEFTHDAAAPGPLYKSVELLDDDLGQAADEAHPAAPEVAPVSWRRRAEIHLQQAGLPVTVEQYARVSGGLALALAVAGFWFVGWLAGVAGLAAGVALPALFVNVKLKARREKYLKQLVGAFELMSRILRAGQSIPEAFRAAVEAFDDPLSAEFGQCLHQIEHGLRPESAYRELSVRSGVLELRIFVIAMSIQRQTGVNLAEVLDRLAGVVRARLRLRQKMRALTAEGRLQSLTLTLLPVVTFAVMYVLNRQYTEALLEHWKLPAATAGCMAIGVVWIRNIMNFEG